VAATSGEEAAEPLPGESDITTAAEARIDEHQAGAGRLDQEATADKAPQLFLGRPV
jgi:hypothetical protein